MGDLPLGPILSFFPLSFLSFSHNSIKLCQELQDTCVRVGELNEKDPAHSDPLPSSCSHRTDGLNSLNTWLSPSLWKTPADPHVLQFNFSNLPLCNSSVEF